MLTDIHRSSHRRCSIKKGVPKNFAKFTGKHLWQILRISSYSLQMRENTDLKNSMNFSRKYLKKNFHTNEVKFDNNIKIT